MADALDPAVSIPTEFRHVAEHPTFKRSASTTFEEGPSRKRSRESSTDWDDSDLDAGSPSASPFLGIGVGSGSRAARLMHPTNPPSMELRDKSTDRREHRVDGNALAEDLAQELQCGCCAALVYKPVIVSPCQHFFCGSCCTLWIKNGGTNCPACRTVSTSVSPSRALQTMVDVLLRAAPQLMRAEDERLQADEIYSPGRSIRIPTPKELSPEPQIPATGDFARPCPHCTAGNQYGWRCPNPIPDPGSDSDAGWHLDEGVPPGHGFCGNCEVLLALQAPSTTRCDFCQVSFCGINVQSRCVALPLLSQQPHGMTDVADLIQSPDVYECFEGNTVEVEIMLDYMNEQRLTPKHVYREIVQYIETLPRGFADLIEHDLFSDLHAVSGGTDPDPTAPRSRVCRMCAAEILLWGLKEWWIRERKKGLLDESISSKRNCPDGAGCRRQSDLAHAKEYNHIISPTEQATTHHRSALQASEGWLPFAPESPPAPPSIGPSQLPSHQSATSSQSSMTTSFLTSHPMLPSISELGFFQSIPSTSVHGTSMFFPSLHPSLSLSMGVGEYGYSVDVMAEAPYIPPPPQQQPNCQDGYGSVPSRRPSTMGFSILPSIPPRVEREPQRQLRFSILPNPCPDGSDYGHIGERSHRDGNDGSEDDIEAAVSTGASRTSAVGGSSLIEPL